MLFTDSTGGYPFAKDPAVVRFQGKYYLYYTSAVSREFQKQDRYTVGVACSDDMEEWEVVDHLDLTGEVEKDGICAPGAIVLDGVVHLFYQSYQFGVRDSICHAVSKDGIHFERDKTNPIYRTGESWSCGRAIDADVVLFQNKLYLYVATRDSEFRIQMIGAAVCDNRSDFSRPHWKEAFSGAVLKPELEWEGLCTEAPATVCRDGKVYLFYGGAYNCAPQRIGCAVSEDGIHFERISKEPLLTNGKPGEWNSLESGHPYVFEDDDGSLHLFYQGADDNRTWRLSRKEFSIHNHQIIFKD